MEVASNLGGGGGGEEARSKEQGTSYTGSLLGHAGGGGRLLAPVHSTHILCIHIALYMQFVAVPSVSLSPPPHPRLSLTWHAAEARVSGVSLGSEALAEEGRRGLPGDGGEGCPRGKLGLAVQHLQYCQLV